MVDIVLLTFYNLILANDFQQTGKNGKSNILVIQLLRSTKNTNLFKIN